MILADLRPPATLWTIGHSSRSLEELRELLRLHGVTRVADVRRFAGSRRQPHFHPESLERSLADAGIAYTALPGLGGRRRPRPDSPHQAWRNVSFRGYADHMRTPEFADGARELARLARADRVAMMCAEAVWWRCHRSMIADAFKAHGWTVLHVLGPGEPREHPYTAVARIVDGDLAY